MRTKRLAVSALSAVLLTTCATVATVALTGSPALASYCYNNNGPDEAMSRERALGRAQRWVDKGLTYDQNICSGTPDQYYRHDCSGLVSMAWGLDHSMVVEDFYKPGRSQPFWSGVTEIAIDALRPGDAIVYNPNSSSDDEDHMELFARWVNPLNHSQGAYVYSFNSNGETVRNPYANSNKGNLGQRSYAYLQTVKAIRYNKIVEDASTFANTFDHTLRVFARGTNGNALNELYWTPGSWNTGHGGSIVGHPTLTTGPDGNLQLFARGTDSKLYHWAYVPGQGWLVEHELMNGPTITGDPSATYFAGSNTLEVFARGTDNKLRRWAWQPGNGWIAQGQDLGGNLLGSPAALADPTGTLRVVAVGNDGMLRHWSLAPGGAWNSNALVGGNGNLVGDPAVTISQDGALQVLLLDTNGEIRQFAYLNGWAVNNASLGGASSGYPAVTTSWEGTLQIVARGANTYLRHKNYVWGTGWSSWSNLSGSTSIYSDVAITNGPQGNLQIYAVTNAGTLAQWHFDYAGGTNWGSANWGGSLYHS
jgi:hypothetical protein